MTDFRDLVAYQKGFNLAMDIFDHTKSFPREEMYSLTDQVRRSSRSVCSCLAESYAKRSYPKHFVSKLTDSDMENNETKTWLHFAKACDYLTQVQFDELISKAEEVGKILGYMIKNPHKFT